MKIPMDMTPGTIHETKVNGALKIIDYQSSKKILVEFIDTGYRVEVQKSQIQSGKLKDRMKRSVYGVGYLGIGSNKVSISGVKTKEYTLWSAMMQRCYCLKYQQRHPSYIDCKVCDEWHNFQNFADWCVSNYPEDKEGIDLDKDIKSQKEKIYSPITCVFVKRKVNAQHGASKEHSLLSPNGDRVIIKNLREFCRNNGLTYNSMQRVSQGIQKSHSGWKRA